MKNVLRIGSWLCLMAMFFNMAHAQDEQPVDCDDAQTQVDMNACSEQDFEKADAALNKIYKKAVISQMDVDKRAAEMDPDYVGAVKALKKAQRAWIDYRDGHCEGIGYGALGGSMQSLLVSGCKTELTQNRIKELNELIKGPGN